MTDIEYNLKNLVRAVRSGNEYNQYHRLLEKIKQDEELYKSMCEFRQKSFMVQMENSQDSIDRLGALRNEYSQTVNNSMVAEFLIAELRLNKLARQISSTILEGLDLDVDFL